MYFLLKREGDGVTHSLGLAIIPGCLGDLRQKYPEKLLFLFQFSRGGGKYDGKMQ